MKQFWLWTRAFTKLKLLARLAVYTAAVTMAWGIFAAKGTPQTVADTKVDKEKEEAIAALQESQEAHSTLQEEQKVLKEKLTVLEAKARTALAETEKIVDALTVSNREAERERGEMAAVLQQLEEKHAALAKCLAEETGRGDAVRRKQAATQSALEVAKAALTVSQLEAVAAQAEALAEKERAADALSVLKRDTSASLERVVRESAVKTKLAEKEKLKMAGAIRGLQRGIMELKGNVKDEKRRVYAANMAMQKVKKKKAELVTGMKADEDKGEAIAAPQGLQERHSTLQEEHKTLQEKHTVLEAKAMEAIRTAADAEGKIVAEQEARRATETELMACRKKALGAKEEAVEARAETVVARAETVGATLALAEKKRFVDALTASHRDVKRERGKATAVLQELQEQHAASETCLMKEIDRARREQAATQSALEVSETELAASKLEVAAAKAEVLAEKERAADALAVSKRDASATLTRVERENTMKAELAEKARVETAGAIGDLRREILELKGSVEDEERKVYAANKATEEITKKNVELSTEIDEAQRLTEEANTEREAMVSALSKAKAETTTLQQKVAQLEAKQVTRSRMQEAAPAIAANSKVEVIATRTPTWSECEAAIRKGDVDVLKRAKRSSGLFDALRKDKNACSSAARSGHLEVLQWLRANGCPWDKWTCSVAATNGHLEVLQWLRANGCPWDKWACSGAARNGHLEVLQWLRANGCPWDTMTCSRAAMNGHLEVLQWLRANGCPWNEIACTVAARNGHLEVLQWLRPNGCPWDATACSRAAESGHLEVVQWLRANGYP